MNEKKKKNLDETFALAVKNHQNNNFKVAEKLYIEVLKINPNYAEAYSNLGAIFSLLENLQKAKNCYKKAIKINPSYATAYNNLGVVLQQLGESKKAKNCYERAIKINPNYAAAYNNLGSTFKKLGSNEKAKSCYEKTIKINPNYVDAYKNLGTIFRKLEKFQEAANYFKKVNTALGNAQFLECTYLSNGMTDYNKILTTFSERDPINVRIASLAAYVSKKENIKNIYPFCKNPLDYFFSINLKNEFQLSSQFSDRLLETSKKLGSSWLVKDLIKHGKQSKGNLLENPVPEIAVLKQKIVKQIGIYRKHYKNSNDYYISKWPTKSKLFGWYIKLKKQGQLKSHIHEDG